MDLTLQSEMDENYELNISAIDHGRLLVTARRPRDSMHIILKPEQVEELRIALETLPDPTTREE